MTELLHLLTDWHHWAFEGVSDLLFAGIGVVWHGWWVRRHDSQEHPMAIGCAVACGEGHTFVGECELRISSSDPFPEQQGDRW